MLRTFAAVAMLLAGALPLSADWNEGAFDRDPWVTITVSAGGNSDTLRLDESDCTATTYGFEWTNHGRKYEFVVSGPGGQTVIASMTDIHFEVWEGESHDCEYYKVLFDYDMEAAASVIGVEFETEAFFWDENDPNTECTFFVKVAAVDGRYVQATSGAFADVYWIGDCYAFTSQWLYSFGFGVGEVTSGNTESDTHQQDFEPLGGAGGTQGLIFYDDFRLEAQATAKVETYWCFTWDD